jgi:hypothetical protein
VGSLNGQSSSLDGHQQVASGGRHRRTEPSWLGDGRQKGTGAEEKEGKHEQADSIDFSEQARSRALAERSVGQPRS